MYFFYKGGGGIFKVCISYVVCIVVMSCRGNLVNLVKKYWKVC